MTDPEPPPAPAERVNLPRVKPLGGSKWVRFFSGADKVSIADPVSNVQDNAVIHPDGRVLGPGDAPETELDIDQNTVFALEAGEPVSLGQFLAGGLNVALQWPDLHPFAGPVLTARQTDVLARLGRLRDYTPLIAPRCYRHVISARFLPRMAPGAVLRLAADRLRAPAAPPGVPVAILPVRPFERFGLVNRASLTAWLRAKRFAVIEPERLKLPELIGYFAAAPLVLLADSRQAGLLGLCHPGTKILEIAPEGWLSAEAHYLSTVFGLDWRPFLAAPPSYPLRGTLPFGSLVPCSYEISIRELALALQTLGDS